MGVPLFIVYCISKFECCFAKATLCIRWCNPSADCFTAGTAYKSLLTPDGRREGRYTAGRDPETGKAVYKNVLGKTQAEVKAKLKQAIQENAEVDTFKAAQRLHSTTQHTTAPVQ